MENVLSYMTFIPVAGMVVVLLLPSRSPNLVRWVSAAFTVPPLLMACWLVRELRPDQARSAIYRKGCMDTGLQYSVFGRRRWPQHLYGAVNRSAELSLYLCFLGYR